MQAKRRQNLELLRVCPLIPIFITRRTRYQGGPPVSPRLGLFRYCTVTSR